METEYTVIEQTSVTDLVTAVNKAAREGWRPLGGVSSEDGIFYQAMIRERRLTRDEMQRRYYEAKEKAG